ncbi:MAG: LPS assembly protein LptD [Pseudomonadota bacterium]|nr:LPS assembly protein LptD [Pseudomonadota bacterium]
MRVAVLSLLSDHSPRFRLRPLTTALLYVGSLSAGYAYAEQPDRLAEQIASLPPSTEQWQNAPAGYLSLAEFDELQASELALGGLPRTTPKPSCRGVWVTPIPAQAAFETSVPPADEPITVTADYGYYAPDGRAELSGDVHISQTNRLLTANQIQLNPQRTTVEATGDVQLSEAGLTTSGEKIRYNMQDQSAEFSNSRYVSETLQAHGQAEHVARNASGILELKNTAFSTCEPDNQVWTLKTAQLELNPDTGRGTAKRSTLYIHDTPIISLPWFNFPIDDRRSSGFLIPKAGYTNDGGLEASIPYYFNLAPNYDLTLTPRIMTERYGMLEAEARGLTEHYGAAVLSGGYLPSDPRYDHQDRTRASLQHDWVINPEFTSVIDLNYVSDKDYFTDLGNDPLVSNHLNQERSLSLFYQSQKVDGLTGTFRVQGFQTVDPATPDIDRPYARLPQLLLNYHSGSPLGWQYDAQHDSAYFKRSITDGSGIENSGIRVYNQLSTQYNYRRSWGHVIPAFSAQHVLYQYDEDSLDSQNRSKDDAVRDAVVPQFSLDAGLILKRQGQFLQTLEPRLFYAYSPYVNQDDFPNFDSAPISRSYNQLFRTHRFIGHDRLEDNHFATLGLVHRLYDQDGLELLRLGIGQSRYFKDRRVRLNADDAIATERNSGPALELSSQLTEHLRIDSTALWQSNGSNASTIAQLNYQNPNGHIYHAGYIQRREVFEQNQQALRQVTAGIIQPIHQQWRAFGYLQYDLDKRITRDGLFGLDYDSCCWRVALYGRSYYNDLDDPSTTKPRRLIMAELTLKGLGGLSGNLANLLRQKIIGYSQVENTWNSR